MSETALNGFYVWLLFLNLVLLTLPRVMTYLVVIFKPHLSSRSYCHRPVNDIFMNLLHFSQRLSFRRFFFPSHVFWWPCSICSSVCSNTSSISCDLFVCWSVWVRQGEPRVSYDRLPTTLPIRSHAGLHLTPHDCMLLLICRLYNSFVCCMCC